MTAPTDGPARPEPGVRVLCAPNPSAMTFRGTNTYVLGEGRVTVIDPGPDDPRHLAAILSALDPGEKVARIVVTHAHLDHSALARPLSDATGAPILAFGGAEDGRSPAMQRMADAGLSGGGEGLDRAFSPDLRIAEGDVLDGDGFTLRVLHTPGHLPGHVALDWGGRLFCGDHVMGWATSIVSPPDGDMGAYMASLDRLARQSWRRLYPGHGDPIDDAAGRLATLIAHRQARESAILAALARGLQTPAAIARAVYADTPAALMRAAERNVLAHLIDLTARGIVQARDDADGTGGYGLSR
ncbi:MAG TPA: MBL fold metallo-hydrolase [Paracoccaceae bacterium]|nr:MBL fold metallo-hydrolase [Paracoccaceae bacterium]